MSTPINTVKEFLNEKDWKFSQIEDKAVLLFGISANNGSFQCVADLVDDNKQLVFFSICGANVPPEKRGLMLELLNRINYELVFGSFIMNHENGEIRYRCSVSYEAVPLTKKLIEEVVFTNIGTMDGYLPCIMGLIFNDITVEEALKLPTTTDSESPL